jgi:tetratricopeptide (TPR) repeat protein
MLSRVLVGVVFLVGCKGKETAAPATESGSGSAIVAAPPAPKPAAGSGSAAAVEDPKLRAAYRAGMQKGRKATDKKQWAEAIAGFDAALAAKKGDARAMSERGYARLLEGSDLTAALRDLDLAASGTKDLKLQSQIWFNRGLIEEKRGNEVNATAAFVIANQLRPTAAAKAKIAGKATCPVSVVDGLELGDEPHKTVDAANWLALAKAIEVDDTKVTKEDIWEALTGERTEPTLPVVISNHDFAEEIDYLVLAIGGGMRAIPLGAAQGGRCPGFVTYDVAEANATRILVSGAELYDGGYTYMCEGKDDELVECTGADNEVSRGTACFGGTPTQHDIVVDRATGKVLLSLEQPKGTSIAKAALAPDGVKLSGLGCDRIEPIK